MIRPFVIQAAQFRVTWLVIGLLVGTMIVGTAFALANITRLGTPRTNQNPTITQQHPGYGFGYPLRGGLAGPSFAQLDQHPGYGIGYPMHYGLAGPSFAQLGQQHPGYGMGYPLHGGLGGPSWVDSAGE